jgi:amidase
VSSRACPRGSTIFIGDITEQGLAGTTTDRGGGEWTWTAVRRPSLENHTPRTHNFSPDTFLQLFQTAPPALNIRTGDTVRTWTLGAGGRDASGKRRGVGLTGPFFIEDAFPGDTLAVKLNRVRANATFGDSHGLFHPAAVTPSYYDDFPKDKPMVSWRIDHGRNVAVLSEPSEKLKAFSVPLRPMIGMIGVAPGGAQALDANVLGSHGGNLDYNRITEGVTV